MAIHLTLRDWGQFVGPTFALRGYGGQAGLDRPDGSDSPRIADYRWGILGIGESELNISAPPRLCAR
jgi:hypothetical protein